MKYILAVLLVITPIAGFTYVLDIEAGLANPGYNNVQVPGDTGTKFSLSSDLSADSKMFYRIRFTKEIANDKYLSILYAPLSLNANGTLKETVNFNGDTFAAGTDVKGVYRFDSYRVSYWKVFKKSDNFNYKLGATAKIRDASIRISGNGIVSEKKNTGFVPLLNFGFDYSFNDRLSIVFDADALAGGPGRAEDVLVAFKHKASKNTAMKFGYRIVEGGADVSEVYNFALINYLVLGYVYSF